jgi:hypothetical protein
MDIEKISKCQGYVKGFLYRKNNLPNSILFLQKILKESYYECNNTEKDGRIRSIIDESKIVKILLSKNELKKRLYISKPRHWFDISIYDYRYGILPINIKTTTTNSSDNTGNLAMCVYAMTNENLDLQKMHNNGKMSELLIDKLRDNELNKEYKKDYYFLVVNKTCVGDVIVNSFRGLNILTPNINNLPFQIKWSLNRKFCYHHIDDVKKKFIEVVKKPKPSWREKFLQDIRDIK